MIPRKLPIINLDGEEYFLDLRLSQLRKIHEPHKFVDLSPSETRDFLEVTLYLELAQRFGGDSSSRTSSPEDVRLDRRVSEE